MCACAQAGDPGAYNPWEHEDWFRIFGFNKGRKPFDTTSMRDLMTRIFGVDAPPPGAYYPEDERQRKANYPADNAATTTVFTSKSLQRPVSKSDVPAPNHYSPNINSIHKNMRDAGAHMRSTYDRFGPGRFKVMTEPEIGPGVCIAFPPQNHATCREQHRCIFATSLAIYISPLMLISISLRLQLCTCMCVAWWTFVALHATPYLPHCRGAASRPHTRGYTHTWPRCREHRMIVLC